MFSGIVEEAATVVALEKDQSNLNISLKCSFTNELKIDQSISHNGVCLTVVSIDGDVYTVTAIKETLDISNLGLLVQGHVDQTAICKDVTEVGGSWYFTFEYEFDKEKAAKGYMTVDKGSVTVNGVSLTVVEPTDNSFKVAIIPYTYEHTNFHQIKVGSVVNLEFDIIGKYISRLLNLNIEQ